MGSNFTQVTNNEDLVTISAFVARTYCLSVQFNLLGVWHRYEYHTRIIEICVCAYFPAFSFILSTCCTRLHINLSTLHQFIPTCARGHQHPIIRVDIRPPTAWNAAHHLPWFDTSTCSSYWPKYVTFRKSWRSPQFRFSATSRGVRTFFTICNGYTLLHLLIAYKLFPLQFLWCYLRHLTWINDFTPYYDSNMCVKFARISEARFR